MMPGDRSSIAIFGSMAFSTALAFAYRPMSSPAWALSVAKSASTADPGCVGVSRAMTVTPAWRAFSIAGTTAVESAGVMRMPFAPSAVIFAIAATWLALSMSLFPAAVSSFTLSSPAVFFAVSFILTKNGLLSRFVIRPTVTSSSSPPHAATPMLSRAAAPNATRQIERGAETAMSLGHQWPPSITSAPPPRRVRRSNSA